MEKNTKIFEELQARGLLAQLTDEAQIRDLVNNGKATAADVNELISKVQRKKKKKTGVELECEVKFV